MKTKHYVAVAAFATLAMAGCTGQKNATNTSGIDLANMDTTVSAGTEPVPTSSVMPAEDGTTHTR